MEKLGPTLVAAAAVVLILTLMAAGWRNRRRRQSDVAAPDAVPDAAELSAPLLAMPGQYVVTTTADDWLDRIAVHALGIRTNATVTVHRQGVALARDGAADVFIGADRLERVRTESGMAGKFVEKDGLVVITWSLGVHRVDTGFRTRRAADRTPLVTAIEDLIIDAAHRDHPDKTSDSDADATPASPLKNEEEQ